MAGELPVCKRCCFCLPLRYGLLTWGYIKLITSFLLIIVMSNAMFQTLAMLRFYRGHENLRRGYILTLVTVILVLALLVIDFVLNIVFITGGHRKNVKLLRLFYFYSIVLWVLMILLNFIVITLMYYEPIRSWIIHAMDFVIIVIQAYFVLLLRSEILKLKNNSECRFVNNAAESDVYTNVDEEEITIDKEETGEVSEKENTYELRETQQTV